MCFIRLFINFIRGLISHMVLLACCTLALLGCHLAFATTFELQPSQANQAFYRTHLPEAVYRSNVLPNTPWRVINGAGETVPHAVVNLSSAPNTLIQHSLALPIFPLSAKTLLHNTQATHTQLTIDILNNQQAKPTNQTNQTKLTLSQQLYLNAEQQAQAQNSSVVYLLHNPDAAKNTIQELTLQWQGAQDQMMQLEVLASDDLEHFTPIATRAIAQLSQSKQGKEQIFANKLIFNTPSHAEYLQIKQINAEPIPPTVNNTNTGTNTVSDAATTMLNSTHSKFILTEVLATALSPTDPSSETRTTKPTNTNTNTTNSLNQILINPIISHSTTQTFYDFQIQGHFAANKAQIYLPQMNTMTSITLYARHNLTESWQEINHSSVYRLAKTTPNKQDNQELLSPAITLEPNTAHYWRIAVNSAGGGIGKGLPAMTLSWLPQTLVWNARGTGPFSLVIADPQPASPYSESSSINIADLLLNYTPHQEHALIAALPEAYLNHQALNLSNHDIDLDSHLGTSANQDKNKDKDKETKSPYHNQNSDWLNLWLWLGLGSCIFFLGSMVYALIRQNANDEAIDKHINKVVNVAKVTRNFEHLDENTKIDYETKINP